MATVTADMMDKFSKPVERFLSKLEPNELELLISDKLPLFVNIETVTKGIVWEDAKAHC